jgi:hypothetical protein
MKAGVKVQDGKAWRPRGIFESNILDFRLELLGIIANSEEIRRVAIFRDITLCSLLEVNRYFG